MITLNVPEGKRISQKSYEEILDELAFHRLHCPCCGRGGCLKRHGYYTRGVKVYENPEQSEQTVKLRILRVKCAHCGTTHALLPSYIVPYTHIRLEEQSEIIRAWEGVKDYDVIMERNSLLDCSDIRNVIRRYRKHWKERLACAGLSVAMALAELVRGCFQYYTRQFMQLRVTPNGLFL